MSELPTPRTKTPRTKGRRPGPWLVAGPLLLLGVSTLLLAPIPASRRESRAMMDLCHAPLFAFLTVIVWLALARFTRMGRLASACLAWAIATAFGGAMEILQHFTHRGPSWADAANNGIGAAAGICLFAAMTGEHPRWRRWLLAAFGVAALAMAEYRPASILYDAACALADMPRLASFETERELSRWQTVDATFYRDNRIASEGLWSLGARLQPARYAGVGLVGGPWNWRGWQTLALDVWIDEGAPVSLIVKVTDDAHNGEGEDRFDGFYALGPGKHELRIPLADIAAAPRDRLLDLARVKTLELFALDLHEPRTIHVDNIRLE